LSLDRWQGAEQEYAAGQRPIRLFEALGRKGVYAFKQADSVPRAFLVNGGLCYVHSNLLEVCTPECRDPLEAVAYGKACDAYARLASWAHEEETGERVHVYKTNIAHDPKGERTYTTVGSHENYLVERRAYQENMRLMVPYLILRQVFCGAGGYVDGRYMVSPRVVFPRKVFSEVSADYPLMSTRDESHAGETHSRAHIVNGEGARSEYTTFLKHAFTGYVLKAIERGHLRSVPEIKDPIESNKAVSMNLEGDWTVPLVDGATMKVTDYLNSFYLEAVERVFADAALRDHDLDALRGFKWVLGKLDEGHIEALDTSIEWAIKLSLAETCLEELGVEEGLDPDTAREAALFQYTSVTDPLYEELVERHSLRTVVSETDVEKAFNRPPGESRGELRVALARRFGDEVKTISWSYLKVRPELHMYPFEFNTLGGWTPEKIEEKIAEIESRLG
jgi:proteasome accessory factor A